MADLSIRNLDDQVRERLRQQAAQRGHSMEAEVRRILTEAVAPHRNWLESWREEFARAGGVDLDLPERTAAPRSPDF